MYSSNMVCSIAYISSKNPLKKPHKNSILLRHMVDGEFVVELLHEKVFSDRGSEFVVLQQWIHWRYC